MLTVAVVPTRAGFGVNALHLEAADLAERLSVNVYQRDVEEGLAVARLRPQPHVAEEPLRHAVEQTQPTVDDWHIEIGVRIEVGDEPLSTGSRVVEHRWMELVVLQVRCEFRIERQIKQRLALAVANRLDVFPARSEVHEMLVSRPAPQHADIGRASGNDCVEIDRRGGAAVVSRDVADDVRQASRVIAGGAHRYLARASFGGDLND